MENSLRSAQTLIGSQTVAHSDESTRSPLNGTDEDALAYAVGRYALGGISIGKAAELADVDRWTMLEVLKRAGITPRLGPETVEDARREVAVALGDDPDDYVARFEDTDAPDDDR